jgi:hypothetical protein
VVLQRRARGLSVGAYRDLLRLRLGEAANRSDEVIGFNLAFARDPLYRVGEPPFDSIAHYWFANAATAERFLSSADATALMPRDDQVVDAAQNFPLLLREHWVIGPEPRP